MLKERKNNNEEDSERHIDIAYEEFCENLELFRKVIPVKTICMHRSPQSAYDNKDIWKKYDYKALGHIGEPYFDIDFDKVFYLTDALLDHFEYKLDHLLKWEDRNSMCFSLESRVPFLDFRLIVKTFATTSDWKIRKGMTKYILSEAMKDILPEKIRLRRDKIGLGTPQDEWFREPIWQTIITEVLESESFKSRNLVDPNIATILYQKHLLGEINISKENWKWFREFID